MRPRHKFGAVRTTVDQQKFDSKAEARYYQDLVLRKRVGEVLYWHRQVPILLPGGVIYRVDFQEFHADGTVVYVDVKGMETAEFKIKKKIVEAEYPFKIEIVKGRR